MQTFCTYTYKYHMKFHATDNRNLFFVLQSHLLPIGKPGSANWDLDLVKCLNLCIVWSLWIGQPFPVWLFVFLKDVMYVFLHVFCWVQLFFFFFLVRKDGIEISHLVYKVDIWLWNYSHIFMTFRFICVSVDKRPIPFDEMSSGG